MQKYWTRHAWVQGEWLTDVEFAVGPEGMITSIQPHAAPGQSKDLAGIVIPGMANVHSHAFQWTFAGLSEFRTVEQDSFWSWREQMYQSVERLSAEEYYERACQLYRMMLAAGYTEVGEFHYIHNQPDGQPYPDLACLASELVRAAVDTGIGICMIPVLYQRGGFDDRPLQGAQRRFQLSTDQLVSLCHNLQDQWGAEPGFRLGVAFHSLRAVNPEVIGSIVDLLDPLLGPDGPIHIHVAEQLAEVQECEAVYGKRPVELLLDMAEVNGRWCLIHATHMTYSEMCRIADSGAVVGLCPTTEANLGDGLFPTVEFLEAGGKISIGSDSHVALDPFAELRLLEYGQRLTTHRRAVLCDVDRSCGERLYREALEGGARALGRATTGELAVGHPANLVVLDASHPVLAGCSPERILDRLVFCQWGSAVLNTMVRGKLVFENGLA